MASHLSDEMMGHDSPPEAAAGSRLRISPVRKAYEQVADQLRAHILSGDLPPGHRLPSEEELKRQFGISRATVREALRALTAQGLVRTARGATGGSFVMRPTAELVLESFRVNVNLLVQAGEISLDGFLEVRGELEVLAVRLAAERRTEKHLDQLRAVVAGAAVGSDAQPRFLHHDFHSLVCAASDNRLLAITTEPIFSVLHSRIHRSQMPESFHRGVDHDHLAILEAIEAADPDAAAEAMVAHLAFLRPTFEKVWFHSQ
ncbi:MAG TPA: FCD domain-containing protein [Solirubrobacteraceae bacterium]|nr:FCD domain-containing protein [Solirubrobacteraceae bacterium]